MSMNGHFTSGKRQRYGGCNDRLERRRGGVWRAGVDRHRLRRLAGSETPVIEAQTAVLALTIGLGVGVPLALAMWWSQRSRGG